MKKVSLLIVAFATLFLTSCGGEEKKDDKKSDDKKEAKKDEVQEEAPITISLVEMDLTDHGYPVTIEVPDNVVFEKGDYNDILKNPDGTFAITITTMEWTKDEALGEAKKNDMNKLKEVLEESENGYFIQTEVMRKDDFHMWYSVDAGGEEPIIFENDKGNMPTKSVATVMWNSLKSVKVK
jgi:hypothetical protein